MRVLWGGWGQLEALGDDAGRAAREAIYQAAALSPETAAQTPPHIARRYFSEDAQGKENVYAADQDGKLLHGQRRPRPGLGDGLAAPCSRCGPASVVIQAVLAGT
jgi:hypothetical protein